MTQPCLIAHVPCGHPSDLQVLAYPVADGISRMTDLCRALGILEAWQTAASLDGEVLVRIKTAPLATARIDRAARSVNGVGLDRASPDQIDRELAGLDKIKAVAALKGTIAFVAKAIPAWTPAERTDRTSAAAAQNADVLAPA